MSGDLPLLSLSLSDMRLQEILELATSIPLPEAAKKEVDKPTNCYVSLYCTKVCLMYLLLFLNDNKKSP